MHDPQVPWSSTTCCHVEYILFCFPEEENAGPDPLDWEEHCLRRPSTSISWNFTLPASLMPFPSFWASGSLLWTDNFFSISCMTFTANGFMLIIDVLLISWLDGECLRAWSLWPFINLGREGRCPEIAWCLGCFAAFVLTFESSSLCVGSRERGATCLDWTFSSVGLPWIPCVCRREWS